MTTTTATKAVAGGLSVKVAMVVLYLIAKIPGFDMIPPEVQDALTDVIGFAVAFLMVFYSPPNRTIPVTDNPPSDLAESTERTP